MIWVDVYDASGNLLGNGPVMLRFARVNRVLDDMGRFSLQVSADDYAISMLQRGRRLFIYEENAYGTVREVGNGIVEKRTFTENDSDITMTVEGNDLLKELTQVSVLLGRVFDETQALAVIAQLIALKSGWATSCTETFLITRKFDAISAFAAIQQLAKDYGYHFRLGTERTLEFGAFGDVADVLIVGPDHAANEEVVADNVGVVERIDVIYESAGVINWLIPMGAGTAAGTITLANATRTSPYTIQSDTGPDGQPFYYLKDQDSIDAYGEVQATFVKQNIVPLSQTQAAIKRAANALYDAAAAFLQRHSDEQVTYSLVVRGLAVKLEPGDRVRLRYTGYAWNGDEQVDWLVIDADVWVMEVEERVDLDGSSIRLQLSTVDLLLQTDDDVVLNAVQDMQLSTVQTVPMSMTGIFKDRDTLQATNKDAVFTVRLDEQILNLIQVVIHFKTWPLYTWTEWVAPNNFNHNIKVDDQYPTNVHLYVDDVDVSSDYGGPWLSGGQNKQLSVRNVDITDLLFDASGDFRGEHEIKFTCGARAGQIEVNEHPDYYTTPEASHGIIELETTVRGTTTTIPNGFPTSWSAYDLPVLLPGGAADIVALGDDLHLYGTSDYDTGSPPTYGDVDLSGDISGTLISAIVLADSPKYLSPETETDVDIMVLTTVGIYLVVGANGATPTVTNVYTFDSAISVGAIDAAYTWEAGQFIICTYADPVASRQKMIHSRNRGDDWTSPVSVYAAPPAGYLGIEIDPHVPGHVFTIAFIGGVSDDLFESSDYGQTWTSTVALGQVGGGGAPIVSGFGQNPNRYVFYTHSNGIGVYRIDTDTDENLKISTYGPDQGWVKWGMSPASANGDMMMLAASNGGLYYGLYLSENVRSNSPAWREIIPMTYGLGLRCCALTADGDSAYLWGASGYMVYWDGVNLVDKSISTSADIKMIFGG